MKALKIEVDKAKNLTENEEITQFKVKNIKTQKKSLNNKRFRLAKAKILFLKIMMKYEEKKKEY